MSPDYEKITTLLSSNNIFNSVSELHGLLSGFVCAGVESINTELTQQLMGIEDNFSSVIEQLIFRLGKDISAQMNEGDFSFNLLLPNDDEELSIRLHGLGQWCEGFNVGFGGGCDKGDKSLLEETREVLKDFSAIAAIEDSISDDSELEESEENYMEIVEYVRMAAATVFMQNGNSSLTKAQAPEDGAIH